MTILTGFGIGVHLSCGMDVCKVRDYKRTSARIFGFFFLFFVFDDFDWQQLFVESMGK